MTQSNLDMDYNKYDFKDSIDQYVYLSKKGLARETVEEISRLKNEPEWMRQFRLRSYDTFISKPVPNWGGNLSKIDFQNISYYSAPKQKPTKASMDEVDPGLIRTFEKLGIPLSEQKMLSGVAVDPRFGRTRNLCSGPTLTVRSDHVHDPVLGRVERRLREVAALVERRRVVCALEEEVLELGPDVEGVEAQLAHALDRAPKDVARVAFVRLAVRRDDVADHPRDLRAVALRVRHELECRRIRDRHHVRLLDGVEARDGRAVEAHAVVERILDLGRRDGEALEVPFEVGEPEEDEVDALLLDALENTSALGGIARCSVPRLCHLRHYLLL